ncbi:MAG: AmmeMemoRadiSam system protein B, partial [Candidatus Jacksonbacteria bacterium]
MRVNIKILIVLFILLLCLQAGFLILIARPNHEVIHEKLNLHLPKSGDNLPVHYSYFSNQDFFDEVYQQAIGQTPKTDSQIYGGIVPHHLIVKDKIAAFFAGLESNGYQTIILIGPNHFNQGKNDIILSQAQWQTAYGILEPDLKLIRHLSQSPFVSIEESPFVSEHSISGLVSFIKKSFPDARFAPIILKQNFSLEQSTALAQAMFEYASQQKILAIASVDFSHYQPVAVADFHDLKSASVINNFDFDRIYDLEIDSAPSIYALLKYLELAGAQKSQIIFSTNSGLLIDKPDEPTTSHHFFYFAKGEKLSQSPAVNFLFFGDLMLDRHVGEKISKNGLDYVFVKLAGEENRFFKGIDLISANLEGAVTNLGAHYAPNMSYDFAFAQELINQLKKYHFNFFNLANNHFTDQGSRGVNETRQNLSQLGFNYSGCSDGEVGECSSTIVEVANQKIGMAGFSMVYSQFDVESAQEVIRQLAAETDLIIVNIHWGAE